MAQGCLSDDALFLYLDGEMKSVAAKVVHQHLVICDSCARRRDRLVEIGESLQWFFKQEKLIKEAEQVINGTLVDTPTTEQLLEWLADVTCPATDGCIVEHDGTCPHGYPSWLKYLGLI